MDTLSHQGHKTATQRERERANTVILAQIASTMVAEYLQRKKTDSRPMTSEEIIELGKQITAEQAKHKLV